MRFFNLSIVIYGHLMSQIWYYIRIEKGQSQINMLIYVDKQKHRRKTNINKDRKVQTGKRKDELTGKRLKQKHTCRKAMKRLRLSDIHRQSIR